MFNFEYLKKYPSKIMKKKLLLSLVVVFTASFFYFNLEKENKTKSLINSHSEFLKNHPYNKTKTLSKEDRKLQGLPPNAFFEQEYLSEINPATGRTHKENVFQLQKRFRGFKTINKNSW